MTPETFTAIGAATGIHHLMTTTFLWGWMESVHFLGLSLLLGTIGLFDLRLLGLLKPIPPAALHRLVPVGVLGFLLSIGTGFMFLVTMPEQYLYNPAFEIKMAALVAAGLNIVAFYVLGARGALAVGSGQDAPRRAKVFAGLSLGLWIVVIVGGRLITMFRPPYYLCLLCGL